MKGIKPIRKIALAALALAIIPTVAHAADDALWFICNISRVPISLLQCPRSAVHRGLQMELGAVPSRTASHCTMGFFNQER